MTDCDSGRKGNYSPFKSKLRWANIWWNGFLRLRSLHMGRFVVQYNHYYNEYVVARNDCNGALHLSKDLPPTILIIPLRNARFVMGGKGTERKRKVFLTLRLECGSPTILMDSSQAPLPKFLPYDLGPAWVGRIQALGDDPPHCLRFLPCLAHAEVL